MVEVEDGKGGAPQAKAAPGTGKGKWPQWSQGTFFHQGSRPRTPEGHNILMMPDLHRAAKKALGCPRLPKLMFADEAHAQRVCRRCAPLGTCLHSLDMMMLAAR